MKFLGSVVRILGPEWGFGCWVNLLIVLGASVLVRGRECFI